MPEYIIGFIGAGHMNQAIIDGLLNKASAFDRAQLMVSTRSEESAASAARKFAISATTDNNLLIDKANYLVLGVKPDQAHEVLMQLSAHELSDTVLISIVAGIRIADYRKVLGDRITIVRTMPNIAAARQAALTGIYCDRTLGETAEHVIETLFSAIGATAWLDDETQIDGITALSGSGIAYFFRFMEAMKKAGESYGFTPDECYDIITLTALGAATLALEDEANPPSFARFVEKIARPGGTTAEALSVFERHDLDKMLAAAMQAVVERSKLIGDTVTRNW